MATGNTVIQNATIVNEGGRFRASVLIASGRIAQIVRDQELPVRNGDEVVDAEGALLLPGIIDGHVHMREPGLTHKADMESETRAAARGGVTTVLDMPNVVPQTTTLQLLQERYALAEGRCYVNYGFFLGATNNNIEEIKRLDVTQSPGVKLFMGSSTGNMLVDREEVLHRIFRESPTLIVAHCEDTERIKSEELRVKSEESELHLGNNGTFDSSLFTLHSSLPDDLPVRFHPLIRDHEACYRSSELAVRLAKEEGARLHVAHITTARELELFRPSDASAKGAEERFHPDDATANGAEERFHPDDASAKGAEERITAEACVPHLLFTDKDYETLGSRIKCNPAIKTEADRAALRKALTDGRIRTIATDHAPHLLSEKEGGALKAMSGMPMVQFSLPAVLSLVDEGVLSLERAVELMCHNPARLYRIPERGFIREGYKADLALVRHKAWTVTKDCIESKCGWSPLEGSTLKWQVEKTWVGGHLVWDGASLMYPPRGERIFFADGK